MFATSAPPSRPTLANDLQLFMHVLSWFRQRNRKTRRINHSATACASSDRNGAILRNILANTKLCLRFTSLPHQLTGWFYCSGQWYCVALHCPRQADAKWLCGELQWQNARRMPERNPVCIAAPNKCSTGRMEARLQHNQTSFCSWRQTPAEVTQQSCTSTPYMIASKPDSGHQFKQIPYS